MPKVKVIERYPHPKYPRLQVQLRSNSRFLQAWTRLDNKQRQVSLKTSHLPTALKLAEDWYRRELRASVSFGLQHPIERLTADPTIAELFASYRGTLPPDKEHYVKKRWAPIADFWRARTLSAVNAQTFREFFPWRRRNVARVKVAANHTIHKDVILIRQILKHAIERELLEHLPLIPKVGKIESNPRPWLTRDEWQHLLSVSKSRIAGAPNERTRQQRQDTHDQMVFLVNSMMRVGEMLSLHFRDCRLDANDEGEKILLCEVTGKRGGRTCVALSGAASVYERRLKAAGNDKDAVVFAEHHREAFKELLKEAGLYIDKKTGFERNFKSLRSTGISFRILNHPEINLQMLARSCGTSTNMIDMFYAKRLTAEMGKDHLTAMPKRVTRHRAGPR